jgi:hypothetical protein
VLAGEPGRVVSRQNREDARDVGFFFGIAGVRRRAVDRRRNMAGNAAGNRPAVQAPPALTPQTCNQRGCGELGNQQSSKPNGIGAGPMAELDKPLAD